MVQERIAIHSLDRVDLAFMYYRATRTFVKIDNETDIQDLSYKYP